MCYAAIGLGLAIAGTVASSVAQAQQASAQKKTQNLNTVAEQNRAKVEMSQIRTRQAVEAESSALESAKVQKEARKQRSTASTMAGEAGITGPSVDVLLNEYAAQEAAIYSQTRRQAELDNIFTTNQLAAVQAGSSTNLARINEPISRPNYIASALQIGSAGLTASTTAEKRGGWWK